MIEFVGRNGPPEAMLCPALICDACREQVAGRGNILHAVRYKDGAREVSPVYVAHKGRCDQAVTAWMKKAYPYEEGWSNNLWSEAPEFMTQLAHNFEHPFADDTEGEYLPQQLIVPKARE